MVEAASLGEVLITLGDRVRKNPMPDHAFHLGRDGCGLLLINMPGVRQMVVDRVGALRLTEAPTCQCDHNIEVEARKRMAESRIPHNLPNDIARSFDNFAPVEGATSALDAAIVFANRVDGPSNLTLVGGYGTGKSHLAEAIAREALVTGTSRYEYVPHLMDRMRSAYSSDGETVEHIISVLTQVKVLVLDDLGTEKGSDFTQERLTSIVEQRMGRQASTVITTNLNRETLHQKGYERLASRLWAVGTQEAIVKTLTCPDARLHGVPDAPVEEIPW